VRWSWPFARQPIAPAPGGDSPPLAARQEGGATGAWASLPPIQRTVGDARLTAPPAPFLQAVPGTRQLPHYLQPLGHEASPMAPAGLVVARLRPRSGPAPGPLVEAPAVQRQGEGRVPATTTPSGQQPASVSVAQQAAHEVTAFPTEPQTSRPGQLTRQLAVVPAATVAIPNVSLTRWEAAPAGSRLVRSAADATGAAAVAPGGMRRARSVEGSDGPGASRRPSGTEDALRSASPPGDASLQRLPDVAGHDAPASVRRAGLGAPLAPGAPGARPVTAHDLRGAAAQPAAIQRSVGSPVVAAPADSPIRSPGSSRAADGPPDHRLPMLPIARTASRPAIATTSATSGPRRQAPAVPAAPDVRATLGRRPLRPTVPVQREAKKDKWSAADAVGPDRRSTQSWPATSERAEVAAPQSGVRAEVSIANRLPEPASGREGTALAGAAGLPAVQRRMPQRPPSARPGASGGDPAVQRASGPALPLARWSVATTAPVSEANAEPGGPGRAQPTVQTAGSTAGRGPVAAPTATPVVQRIDGAAPVADKAPDRRSDRDLDELAHALFGRIRRQLRTELIHEREAKGLTFDNV
jgi:hypothetical protein